MSKIGLMILCTWYFSHALHCRNVDLDNWSKENDEFFTVLSICFLPETQIFSLKQEDSFCDNVMFLSFYNIAIPLHQKMEKMFIEMYFSFSMFHCLGPAMWKTHQDNSRGCITQLQQNVFVG